MDEQYEMDEEEYYEQQQNEGYHQDPNIQEYQQNEQDEDNKVTVGYYF
jgi:hypothetical protein